MAAVVPLPVQAWRDRHRLTGFTGKGDIGLHVNNEPAAVDHLLFTFFQGWVMR
jgi:hypothetical protein